MRAPLVFRSFLAWGFAGALAVNGAMFCLLPGLVGVEGEKNDLESLNTVHMAKMKPKPPAPKKKEAPKKKKPEKKPEKVFKMNTSKPRKAKPKRLKMPMPAMDLDIDPRISGGIPMVAPPSPEPVLEPGPNFDAVMGEDELDTIPIPNYKSVPRYPYQAKRMGLEGEVKIKFLVDKEGRVSNVTILSADPPEIFNQSVIDAVSTWKYSPGELMGRQVATLVTTTVYFKMEGR